MTAWRHRRQATVARQRRPPGSDMMAVRSRALTVANEPIVDSGRLALRVWPADEHGLRAAARLLALAGRGTGNDLALAGALVMQLAALVAAVAELRQAQQHATQAAAARAAAEQLHAAQAETPGPAPNSTQAQARRPARPAPAAVADRDRPARSFTRPASTTPSPARPRPRRGPGPQPPRRAGPKR